MLIVCYSKWWVYLRNKAAEGESLDLHLKSVFKKILVF